MEKRTQPFDICIICALYEEAEAVLNEFSMRCNVSFIKEFSSMDRYVYYYTTIRNKQGEPLTVLVTWLSDSGPTQTGLDLKPFLHEFRPRFVAMTGICAGYRRKVKLGDLVVAQYAYYYEEGKIIREPEGSSLHLLEMKTAGPTSQVIQYARGFDSWKESIREMKRLRLNRQLKANEEPRCIVAPMASGMAVRGDDPFTWLREKYNRNTVALDMEAATFYRAFHTVSDIHAMVVKGVCDYADMSKNDVYHDYAARASAVYLLSFIQEYVTEHIMPQRNAPPPSGDRLSPVWNIPYPRNPFFLGRERELAQVRQRLQAGQTTALSQPQAISGLGGIGKTQVALEYAYRYHQDYTAVLWARAENTDALISSYVAIASLLRLPEHETKEQEVIVQVVKTWFQTHRDWLLILDNADELNLLSDFLPPNLGGHLLLTTRATATGRLAHRLEIETLPSEHATLFLLRRAALLASDATLDHASQEERKLAAQISQELGGLPLALDQVGAYLEETGLDLAGYWHLYQRQRADLLQRRGGLVGDHPAPVSATWSLSFERVKKKNAAAAELLRLCAYLAPDAIPEEILTAGASFLGPILSLVAADALLLNQAIEVLQAYSLVRRAPREKTLSIHRLVQAVLQDTLEETGRRTWAERAILAVNATFPVSEHNTWPQCERLLPAALTTTQAIEPYHIVSEDAGCLLYGVASYLKDRVRDAEAEPFYQRALHIRQQQLEPNHPLMIEALNGLANLYREQGKYAKAEPLYQQALRIGEQQLGPNHPLMAEALNNLAYLYWQQGKYTEAEPLYQQALRIGEQQLGPNHPLMAEALNNLAYLYREQGKYEQAESLYQRVLCIREQQLEPNHPDVASSLDGLANIYRDQGRYAEAEPLYQRALHIWEQQLGLGHPNVAYALDGLANLYTEQGQYTEAESRYQRALHIREQQLGPGHHRVAQSLNGLANLYRELGKYAEAEPLYQRALHIREQQLGLEHPRVAQSLNGLANLYADQGKNAEAEPLYQRALHLWEQQLGPKHPYIAYSLDGLANLYANQGKYAEAEPLYQRALHIRVQALGSQHPKTVEIIYNLARFREAQGNSEEASM